MSTTNPADAPHNAEPTGSQAHANPADLERELRELVTQVGATFRAFLESERTQQLRREIERGTRDLADHLRTSVDSACHDPRVAEVGERSRQAFSQAVDHKIVQDVQDAIAGGLAQINARLRDIVTELDGQRATAAAPPADGPAATVSAEVVSPAEVPAADEPPADGAPRT
ncbi:MAG: hypothetical protein KGS47_15855 [Chloroflexi bacterium]|nr:hypothetical protein [Chloroflexota bacterium]